jgi:gliding motility-associated-like protein
MTITVNPYLTGVRNVSFCSGNSYTFNGTVYTTSISGVSDTLPNVGTCDSIITLNLTVYPVTYGTQTDTICAGNTYTFNGIVYSTTNNTAKDTLVNAWGCDSVVTLNLTVLPVNPVTITQTLTGCGSILYQGTNYVQSAALKDTFYTSFGCDSVYRTTNLIIYPEYQFHDTVLLSACDFLLYKNVRYEEDTELHESLQTVNGCDSLDRTVRIHIARLQLDITILPETPYEGQQLTISTAAGAGQDYQTISWAPSGKFPDQSRKVQQYTAVDKEIIEVIAEGAEGCRDTSRVEIHTRPYRKDVIIPNAFTPNGDGVNDVFIPVLAVDDAYQLTDFRVFNRWGQLLFSTAHVNVGWDGTFKGQLQSQDVYYYTVKIVFIDGSTKFFKGDMTLLR